MPLQAPPPASLADVLGVRPGRADGARATRGAHVRRVLLTVDAVALFCALLTVELLVGFLAHGANPLRRDALLAVASLPVWFLVAQIRGLYHAPSRRPNHDAAEELGTIVWIATLWSWSVGLLAQLTTGHTPAIARLVALWATAVVFVTVLRVGARAWSRRQSWYRQNALIVGGPDDAGRVLPKLLRHPEYGIHVVASVELPGLPVGELAGAYPTTDHVPVLRGEIDLVELIAELHVDRVIFGPSVEQLPGYQGLLCDLSERHVHVDVVPSWHDSVGARAVLHELEGMAVLAVPDATLSRVALVCKRALDVTVAGLGLLAISPALIACAIAIKFDSPGPVFFRQRRVGRGDRRFEVFKFRSMRADAEAMKLDIAHLNVHGGGTETGMFKIPDDPRVTRVGRWLRRHSIDELPQLLNVLRGDMSLVGPRPLIESEDSQISGRHRRRTALTPGLTGLWQVNGRSDIPFEGMIDLDYLYVSNWSLWGDIKLLLKTVGVVTRGHGAY